MKILVVGYKGFVGSSIFGKLKDQFEVSGITSDDDFPDTDFDVVVNTNGNSRKYWANQNPIEDFDISVRSVYKVCTRYPKATHIFISSTDVYKPHSYGRNKLIAENIVRLLCLKYVLFRCSAIIGEKMKKGVIFDIFNESPLFVAKDSMLQFITDTELSKIVCFFIEKGQEQDSRKIYNKAYTTAGKGSIRTSELEGILNKRIRYGQDLSYQFFDFPTKDLESIYPIKTSREYVEDLIHEIRSNQIQHNHADV